MFRSLGATAASGIGLTAAVSFAVSLFPDGAKWLPVALCKQAEHILLHGESGFLWMVAHILHFVHHASGHVFCVALPAV